MTGLEVCSPWFSDDPLSEAPDDTTRRSKLRRLVEASAKLAGGAVEIERARFLPAVLCQVGLPRQKIEGREFHRVNGQAELIIQAGHIERRGKLVPVTLPYGARPRLVLIHVATQAVRLKTRSIPIGDSLRQFICTLGLDPNGREYAEFRRQIEALAACRLTLGMSYADRDVTINLQPFERFEAWFSHDGRQAGMWPGVLELSERFYENLREYSVPLAHEALVALKGSSLALDVYTWLAHRLYRVSKPTRITWANLREQFGQEYRDPKNFKRKLAIAIRQAAAVYPEARIDDGTAGGLILYPSKAPVRRVMSAGRSISPDLGRK